MTTIYLLTKEAADIARESPRTWERRRMTGEGCPFIRSGKRILYKATDVHDWLESRRFNSTAEADHAS